MPRRDQIRANAAEYLYLILQSKDVGGDTEEAEGVILDTEWSVAQPPAHVSAAAHTDPVILSFACPGRSSPNIASVHEAAVRCTQLLAEAVGEAA